MIHLRFYFSICSGYPQMLYPWYQPPGNVPVPQAPLITPPQTPPPPQQAAAQPAQAPQPQANDNAQANANAGPLFDDEDEDNPNRDWLDKIYTLCRIGILMSIFWFYSSTSRFLLLVVTFLLIYLYQSGILNIFRRNGGKRDPQYTFCYIYSLLTFSKIQRVVYYQCCVLIG